MIYDENEEGKIIDPKYVSDGVITHYKLVCENDSDLASLTEVVRNIISEFIEIGLRSKIESEAIQEVKGLLQCYRDAPEKVFLRNNDDLLMNRIDFISVTNCRSDETVIREHLVGTGVHDPVIKKNIR